ncbi:hypothetical protein ACFL20_12205 [Spirochaetota bacterium]
MRVFLNTPIGKTLLYIALIIFAVGVVYRLFGWFIKNVGTGDKSIPVSRRIFNGIQGVLLSIFSVKIFYIIKSLILDGVLQLRILIDRKDVLAWIMHICIFAGGVPLLIFHALQLPANYSTLDPFMFLRNLFGVIFIAGLVLAIIRRAAVMKGRIRTGAGDIFIIFILLVIFITGFVLEGAKINSFAEYKRMEKKYSAARDTKESKALEAYWVKKYSIVSPKIKEPVAADLLALGEKVNNKSCLSCHTEPQSAFLSFGISKVLKSSSAKWDKAGVNTALLYIHAIACLFLLAYLPFSKMFHLISTPISLVVAEVAEKKQEEANIAIRQAIELDGCSHGGACHEDCPVRKKRDERINKTEQFSGAFNYVSSKSYKDLGSREFKS